jgi:hypothetical protein
MSFSFPRHLQIIKEGILRCLQHLRGPYRRVLHSYFSIRLVALKMRLKDQTDVSCNVNSRSSDLLLGGRVGPVTVKGKGWQSGLGLTCRAIEATVDTCPPFSHDELLQKHWPAKWTPKKKHDNSSFTFTVAQASSASCRLHEGGAVA